VDDGVGTVNQTRRCGVAQLAGQALDGRGDVLEAAAVAAESVPAAHAVAGADGVAHGVAPHEARRPRDRDLHDGHLGRRSTAR
jgi:hypothetical protein